MATDTMNADADSLETTGKSGGSNKLKILILLAVVTVGEAAVMYFLVPAPAGTSEKTTAADGDGAAADSADGIFGEDVAEVEIDAFNVTNSKAADGSVVHISFQLHGVVPASETDAFDQAANSAHRARVRQAVDKVARSSSLEDLNDPGLNTIKRLIKEEINKVLHKSYISEVVISDFKTIEQ